MTGTNLAPYILTGVILMAKKNVLIVKGYILRDGKRLERDELAKEEQIRLAMKWNSTALGAAGYTPVLKAQLKAVSS